MLFMVCIELGINDVLFLLCKRLKEKNILEIFLVIYLFGVGKLY